MLESTTPNVVYVHIRVVVGVLCWLDIILLLFFFRPAQSAAFIYSFDGDMFVDFANAVNL